MIQHDLPVAVNIDGEEFAIIDKCDYRVVLDVISALNDDELPDNLKMQMALYIFYKDLSRCSAPQKAIDEMYKIINYTDTSDRSGNGDEISPRIMDWEHDFHIIAQAVNQVLGYDVRKPGKYTHWHTFVGAYMEAPENCTYATVITIRKKKQKGMKLEKNELAFYQANRKMVDLPLKLTDEEKNWLDEDW